MRTPSSVVARRRPRRPALKRMIAAALVATFSTAGFLLPVTAASAAPASTATSTAGTSASLADTTNLAAAANLGAGNGVLFERKEDAWPGPNYLSYRLAPVGDGSVYLVVDGRCVTAGGSDVNQNYTTLPACQGLDSQKFYFVPADHNPVLKGRPNEHPNEFFYIVGAERQKCLQSIYGGMNYASTMGRNPVTAPCDEENREQLYRVHNDRPSSEGYNIEWQNILRLAVQYGSSRCGIDVRSCQVAPDGVQPAGTYLASDDEGLASFGTLGTTLLGCGDPSAGAIAKHRNVGTRDQSVTIGSSQRFSTTHQESDSVGGSLTLEFQKGVKDVWSAKISGTVNYNHTWLNAFTDEKTRTDSTTVSIPPNSTAMSTWSSQVLTVSGTWRYAANLPTSHGTLAWSTQAAAGIPVSSAADPGTWTVVTTQNDKDCHAGPAATLDTSVAANRPHLTSDPSTCSYNADPTQPQPAAPGGTVGSTVYVCPGNWQVSAGAPGAPDYKYEWYLSAGEGSQLPERIVGSGSSYAVQSITLAGSTGDLFLGVYVTDLGSSQRLESARVKVSAPVALVRPAPGAEELDRSTLVGRLDQQIAGSAFTTSVVDHVGSELDVRLAEGSSLPDGLTLSAAGELAGTVATAGSYPFSVQADAVDEPEQLVLTVLPAATGYLAEREITATLGVPLDLQLVTEAPAALALELTDGELPEGLVLDAATGRLSGTPSALGTESFSIRNAGSTEAAARFTVTTGHLATEFTAAALPAATVGTPYSAPLAGVLGTGSLLALDDPDALPAGLELHATTGVLSGTPTAAGSYRLAVVDLLDPATASTFDLVVAATPGASPAATGGTELAATGSAPWLPAGAAIAVLLIGGLALLLRTRAQSRASAAASSERREMPSLR